MAPTGNGSINGLGRIVTVVKDIGFPIAVTGYLLYRFDGLMISLTAQVQLLSSNVEKLVMIYQKLGAP